MLLLLRHLHAEVLGAETQGLLVLLVVLGALILRLLLCRLADLDSLRFHGLLGLRSHSRPVRGVGRRRRRDLLPRVGGLECEDEGDLRITDLPTAPAGRHRVVDLRSSLPPLLLRERTENEGEGSGVGRDAISVRVLEGRPVAWFDDPRGSYGIVVLPVVMGIECAIRVYSIHRPAAQEPLRAVATLSGQGRSGSEQAEADHPGRDDQPQGPAQVVQKHYYHFLWPLPSQISSLPRDGGHPGPTQQDFLSHCKRINNIQTILSKRLQRHHTLSFSFSVSNLSKIDLVQAIN